MEVKESHILLDDGGNRVGEMVEGAEVGVEAPRVDGQVPKPELSILLRLLICRQGLTM